MAGGFQIGGLVSGLDSTTLIQQLLQLERQPMNRLEQRIRNLETERSAIQDVRSQLSTLRNRARDFSLGSMFQEYTTGSSQESVATASVSGENPVLGSYTVEVTRLATATVANSSGAVSGAVNPGATLASSGISTEVSAGTFSVNGVEITVDPNSQSLDQVLAAINGSGAGVEATYEAGTDRVTFVNTAPGDGSVINIGAADDTSNFLSAIGVVGANQGDSGDGRTQVTSSSALGAVSTGANLNTLNLANGAVSGGSFRINGVAINVDPANDSLGDVLTRINASDAGVTASYDSTTDAIRVVSDTLGSRTINFGGAGDTSNFLSVMNLDTATQTAGVDSEFRLDGGALQTRNSNSVSDAIGGVTLNLQSVGTTTVTIGADDDTVIDNVQGFLDEVNTTLREVSEAIGSEGDLSNDSSIRMLLDYVRTTMFNTVPDAPGDLSSLLDIGISTGDTFDSTAVAQFEIDREAFLEALSANPEGVQALFTNDAGTGIADQLDDYLEGAVDFDGYLNERIKPNGLIDQRIDSYNNQIDQMERRLEQYERRLTQQFTRLEQMTASYQNQSSALAGIAGASSLF